MKLCTIGEISVFVSKQNLEGVGPPPLPLKQRHDVRKSAHP